MKQQLQPLFCQAIAQLQQKGVLSHNIIINCVVEQTRDPSHGDWACSIALMLAKAAKRNPRELAQLIIDQLPPSTLVEKVSIAGPGFINLFLTPSAYLQVIGEIRRQGEQFGCHQKQQKKYLIEFVSANPTGPLHVGHGRGAAYGDCIARLLQTQGYQTHKEYYVNDAGRQMHILATSVYLRYLQLLGTELTFPSNGYKGEYLVDIATKLQQQVDDKLSTSIEPLFADVPEDEIKDTEGKPISGDKEAHIDGLIANTQHLLGDNYQQVFSLGLQTILDDIKQDLGEFRVDIDEWFSEQQLMDNGAITHCFDVLMKAGHIYEKDGALWFAATQFGDEKDRVVRRKNGQTTYFASDIAYHLNKLERGYDVVIDVLGSDHHGYVPRLKAAMQAMSGSDDALVAPLVQFVNLFRGKKKLSMSTRGGNFVSLRDLREEVGNDAARFFYVLRKVEQTIDFDLQLACEKSNENPVFYVQYAHARIASVLRGQQEKYGDWQPDVGLQQVNLLVEAHEKALLKLLNSYPELLSKAAAQLDPHLLTHYLRELAQAFHSYYNHHAFLIDDGNLRQARLCLITACQQLLRNGLQLLGVNAPEQM